MESFKAAISTNNIEILKFLIARKYEFKDLLLNAAMVSNLEVIKIILELNHSEEYINKVGNNGTALFEVIRSPTNKMLIQAIDTLPDYFRQPRIDEIVKQKNKIVEYLLKQEGIDPSISIDSINTPLVEAVRNGNVEAVGLILDFYGDRIKDQGKQIYDAIDVIMKKNTHIFEEKDKLILKQLLKVRKLVQYNAQEDILYHAVVRDDKEIVSELLDSDQLIDLSKRFANGDTYLHLAINERNISSITEIHRLLINHPGIDINSQNALNETPLVKAIKFNNEDLVDLILNHPKFDAKLSLIDYSLLLSLKFENIFMKIIEIESLDVNYNHVKTVCKEPENINYDQPEPKVKITTPLIEAVKIGNLQFVKAIINHSSFDPIKSQIQTCLITAIKRKNLELFKFFMELNGGDVNLKSINNKSLLYFAASNGGNPEILKAILGNEKFDPIKGDIQKSFMNSSDSESMKILVSYDEEHKTNFLNFDKIYLLFNFHRKIQHDRIDPLQFKFQRSYEFLMRKNGLLPMIPSICTSVVSKNIYQRMYYCKTCSDYNNICEICARVCHKGHEIYESVCLKSFNNTCECGTHFNCKCWSISDVYDELYDKFKTIKKEEKSHNSNISSNEFNEDEDEDDYIHKKEYQEKNEEYLKCTLDLAGFNSMSQPMYRCRNCKVDICQSCAIRCHKEHKLNFKGFKNDASCHCFEINDCCCTSRKDVVCTCAFYGKQYFYQSFYNCKSCQERSEIGCCAVCCKKCHHDHNFKFECRSKCFCDCGAHDMPVHCNAMIFPPFNHLSSCTNREQNYQKKLQRLYHCLTCGLTAENQGICEACAIHCHPAHNVVYVGMKEFACECVLLNIKCKAPSCPEISSDGLCNRVKFRKNTISPAFICESCDNDGKNRICKSCALNCHKGHNVHFLEFSKFECQCNPCKCNENKS